MNKKGFELAISTFVVFVLGLLVLFGLVYAVTDGFKRFKSNSDILLSGSEGAAVKKTCEIACESGDKITYCCKNFSVSGTSVKCFDARLDIDCSISCDNLC